MDRLLEIDAFNRIVDQLNNGYLDISDNFHDDNEMQLVRIAIEEYGHNHLDGVVLRIVE